MLNIIKARLFQGHRTMRFPAGPPPAMPDRFRGRPLIDTRRCPDSCRLCADACPTGAVAPDGNAGGIGPLDLGACLFCAACAEACPEEAVSFSRDYRMAVSSREDLLLKDNTEALHLAGALNRKLLRVLGRSLKLRVVSAGGCNACEADVNVLTTIGWDIGRFGVQYVASPRHADGLIVIGPVTGNMATALKKTYDAVPSPRIVIAVGACAISGGPYIGREEVTGGASGTVPVDLFIPGCPPHPLTILDGLLRLLDRIDGRKTAETPVGP